MSRFEYKVEHNCSAKSLNELGALGWLLISIAPASLNGQNFYFVRHIAQ